MQPSRGLSVSSIAKRYGATVALDCVDLNAEPGKIHALVGENGAGKSTLMGVLAGGIRADSGSMTFNGAEYAPASSHDARARGVVLIHQELSLCPHLSVAENILLGCEISRRGWIDRDASHERALSLLRELPHPEITPDRLVRDLSLPAQQIVEICRSIAADTRVLLMDEPTSSLQGADVERLCALIRRLAARGVAIIYISHFLEEVRQIADTFSVLRDGRVAGNGDIRDASNKALISLMVGRDASELFPVRAQNAHTQTALTVRDLSAPPRLKHASFALRKGEILGVAGLLGSGRTELVRALFGLDAIHGGSIELGDAGFDALNSLLTSELNESSNTAHRSIRHRLSGNTTAERVRRGFGYASEDRKGEGLALP
ncbi:MAG: sugar ABC transporter ATP-binding protein, partial [Gemmatimonadaceae bacterium]